ncbi:MAG: SpoIID/LytB domain-containing protein [Lachnospiraceae bacterium]|nr:SpoIID/LytB domain-containing protein [Lachnospiraceae bacterium]
MTAKQKNIRKSRIHRNKKYQKKQKIRRRLWFILALSVLFLGCLIFDCQKKRMFQPEKKQVKPVKDNKSKEAAKKDRDKEKIRVLITNDAMNSIYHDRICVSGTQDVIVTVNGRRKHYKKGKTIIFSEKGKNKQIKRVKISCPNGRIRIKSITRSGKIPEYRGSMMITRKKKGFLVVNTLSVEEYLFGVVPSEMPSSYPMEALKAQAVCARSFAWKQMRSNSYKDYGADVDDTTSFQVYRMTDEDKRTRRAVRATAGKKVYSDNRVITTYYYSTSWGYSASEEEAWGGVKGKNYPVRFQSSGEEDREDLMQEKRFYDFIVKDSMKTFDSGYDWYRWQVKLTGEILGAKLGIGKVQRIRILKRGKSGLIRRIRIIGTKGRVTIEGQEKIRQQLYPVGTEIVRKSSGEKTVLSMLPSAAFTVLDGTEDGKVVFTLLGGGLGHGVGMSQNGAGEMARQGYNYKEILQHYYSHCEIR